MKKVILSSRVFAEHFYRALSVIRAGSAMRRGDSFGQCGEDKWFIDALRSNQIPWSESGFFVDIGANHPVVFSSTFLLYKAGWRGMTVEPIPSLCLLHKNFRPRDICLNVGVGASCENRRFWETAPDLFSSFSNADAQKAESAGLCVILRESEVRVETPRGILASVPTKIKVNYLSIDTEGLDTEILRNWPWDISRPDVISCEALALGDGKSEVQSILSKQGYAPIRQFPVCGFWGSTETAAKLRAE